jgi:hypothetical protein
MPESTDKSIILHEPQIRYADVVRITPTAEDVVRKLMHQSGLSAREIVSGIIVQAAANGLISVERDSLSQHD